MAIEAQDEEEHMLLPNRKQLSNMNRHDDSLSEDTASSETLISDDEVINNTEDSPYPEVRAAARNFDHEHLPYNTIRAWTIGMILCVMGTALNTLYSLRSPRIGLGSLIVLLVGWVMGRAWERWMPARQFSYRPLGLQLQLNPGPFNVKEHTAIMIMASVAVSVANATDVILAQIVFYKQDFGVLYQLLLVISTQSLGYGIAGMLRKLLVYPASMIWPSNLAVVTLLNTMHESKTVDLDPTVLGGNMPKLRWFSIVATAMFFYYFIPGFLAQCLSIPAFLTWMAPNNAVVNQIFGGTTGLSLIPLTFDWTQIAGFVGSPMIPPWHAIANTLLGVVIFYVGLAATLHYAGVWYAAYLPMSDSQTYDNTGTRYNVTRILTPEFTFDKEAYESYSPIFISTTFAINYGLSFATILSLIGYTWINHRRTIWSLYKRSAYEKPDIHMKLMSKYREVPHWWYISVFAVMLLFALITVLGYPTNLPLWAFILAVVISSVFSVPIGIIQAVTNTQIGLNVLTEFIFGYLQPGNPLALMIFKNFGYVTMSQALDFVGDLKFGHYMKLPPRMTFACQLSATVVSCLVQVVVLNLAIRNIDGLCDPTQPSHFTCPGGRVFFSSSVIWGLIGPARVFSPGQIYSGLLVFFAVGATATVALHLAAKRYSLAKHIMVPLVLGGAGSIPPATPLNYLSWGIVGFVFQYWVKKHYSGWWSRLNYLTSSALDLGLALSTIVLFAMNMSGIRGPDWWGNRITRTTMDARHKAIQVVLPPGQKFGPDSW
ncbi:sexual differentiation process protein isp4 [Echria macrotheca]|uniref:Sexual differentiation process protein isp4 n=1 Tax=Echria macrotheca TaxID=438768 RepID=A0AAJ0B5Y2_9PEZI|nr:sexual differentiation process protein isp4 [Echria macrotheca]